MRLLLPPCRTCADASKGNGEPVVQRECSVQCPSGQSEAGALSPAQSPPTAIVAATRDLAQGDIVQLKNFTQHACFNSKHAEVLEACVMPGGDVRYRLRLLGELVGVKLGWVVSVQLAQDLR